MSLLFEQIYQLIKLLNSETGHNQIAAGIACGFILGMTPGFSLQTLIVILFALTFRIQLGAMLVSAFFFKFAGFLLDPVFHDIGYKVLTLPEYKGLFTNLYNMPIVPFTKFNNTIYMGAGVITIALFPVVFFFFRFIIIKYRTAIVEKAKDSKIWKALKASALFKWYFKYKEMYN